MRDGSASHCARVVKRGARARQVLMPERQREAVQFEQRAALPLLAQLAGALTRKNPPARSIHGDGRSTQGGHPQPTACPERTTATAASHNT